MDRNAGAEAGKVRSVEIGTEQAGQRIDNFLIRYLKGVPRSRIYRMVRRGEVRVNRGRIRPTYRLRTGDHIRIPPVRSASRHSTTVPDSSVDQLESRVLYEDQRMLVLNKPATVAVHGGSGISFGVIEALRASRPQAPFLELVHRLDRDTSGCLLLAKRRSQLRALHEMFRAGTITKRYTTLVRGRWTEGKRTVTAALSKNQLKSGERLAHVDPDGKPASTRFYPLSVYDNASLMEIGLDTGRTHQIRVHAAHIGFPIAGDEKYGDPVFNRELRRRGLRRLFLHAVSLQFQDPHSGCRIRVDAPLDDQLQKVLQTFV
ncbi:MAG: 23S rRNA pseudouridine(955/2504/2580) synthase RluC [Gammaproteobacteria bacterium]